MKNFKYSIRSFLNFYYLGDYSGMLYIIDCSNGKLYSSYQCEGLIKTIPCIHPSSDIIYLGAHDQFIHAIHIQVVLTNESFSF